MSIVNMIIDLIKLSHEHSTAAISPWAVEALFWVLCGPTDVGFWLVGAWTVVAGVWLVGAGLVVGAAAMSQFGNVIVNFPSLMLTYRMIRDSMEIKFWSYHCSSSSIIWYYAALNWHWRVKAVKFITTTFDRMIVIKAGWLAEFVLVSHHPP